MSLKDYRVRKTRPTLQNDYERMVPAFHEGSLMYAEHLTRYEAAQALVKNKVVLDIACGSGYGSALLAKSATRVYGVDVNKAAIAYARAYYASPNVTYRYGKAEAIPLDDASVDVAVTFETIEHVADYTAFLREIKRVLKPEGLAILSTPNDLEFAEGNHFHLHEFQYDELKGLVGQYFAHQKPYFQATWKAVMIGDEHELVAEKSKPQFSNVSPKKPDQYLYFYILCSNRVITEAVQPLLALGEHYSERALVAQKSATDKQLERLAAERDAVTAKLHRLERSRSYRLARMLSRFSFAVRTAGVRRRP